LTVHAEDEYGDDVNFAGDGSLLPLNTAMAFPRLVARDSDISSVHFTQKLPKGIALTLGKIDIRDVASKTPLQSGGGITGFWSLAFAAPPSAASCHPRSSAPSRAYPSSG
jgi:porin